MGRLCACVTYSKNVIEDPHVSPNGTRHYLSNDTGDVNKRTLKYKREKGKKLHETESVLCVFSHENKNKIKISSHFMSL